MKDNRQNDKIIVDHICKSYGKRKILDDVSIEINKGEIYGLLGPSGCGKTTTVKVLAGILKPDQGRVTVFGKEVPDFQIMKNVGYMTQAAALYPLMSAQENLKFFGALYGLKKKELNDRMMKVAKLVNLDQNLKQTVKNYSGGMKQRLSLAITLLPEPEILLLDEPTVGIDPLLRKSIWEQLRNLRDQGVTIVITTHVMDEVEKCDRLSMIREGQVLISGSPKEIIEKANVKTMEEAFIQFSKEGE